MILRRNKNDRERSNRKNKNDFKRSHRRLRCSELCYILWHRCTWPSNQSSRSSCKAKKVAENFNRKEQVYANESNDTTMYVAYLANAYCVVNALIDEILEVNK